MQYAQSKARSAPMQREVLTLLTQLGSVSAKELCYFTGATMATVRRLERLGFLSLSLRPVFRTPLPPSGDPVPLPVLNESQNAAYTGLAALQDREKPGAALLYGVTGSGKTSVYVRLIARTLEQGRSAVLLVPEIALTPQLIATLVGYFGKTVAVLHSGLRGHRALRRVAANPPGRRSGCDRHPLGGVCAGAAAGPADCGRGAGALL